MLEISYLDIPCLTFVPLPYRAVPIASGKHLNHKRVEIAIYEQWQKKWQRPEKENNYTETAKHFFFFSFEGNKQIIKTILFLLFKMMMYWGCISKWFDERFVYRAYDGETWNVIFSLHGNLKCFSLCGF